MANAKTITTARNLLVNVAQLGAKTEAAIDSLRALKGMTYADFESVRGDFVAAFCEARGADKADKTANAAARKGWGRILAAIGVKKPVSDSEAAQKKRAQRASKANATEKEKLGEALANPGKLVQPLKGAERAGAIKMELSGFEAHILSLYRRGKYSDLIDILHSEAEKNSPL